METVMEKKGFDVTQLVSETLQNSAVLKKSSYAVGGYTRSRQFFDVYLKNHKDDIDKIKKEAPSGHTVTAYVVDSEEKFNEIKDSLNKINFRKVEGKAYTQKKSRKTKSEKKRSNSNSLTLNMSDVNIKTLKALATFNETEPEMLANEIISEKIKESREALEMI